MINDRYFENDLYWKEHINRQLTIDMWIDEYRGYFDNKGICLELECGIGQYSKRLIEYGYKVISTDISDIALNEVKKFNKNVEKVDMSIPFKYENDSFDLVFSSLAIHCTIGILFRIENNILNCDVQSRSTDIITGLPYDMGFFSVVTELLANLLTDDLKIKISPGYVAMHSNFTQIYDKTANIADEIEESSEIIDLQKMPIIENGQDVLDDIYNLGSKSPKTKFMKWSIENAK